MFTPILAIYPNICMSCIILTGRTRQILTIQFSLLRNSWFFRKKKNTKTTHY